MSTKIRSKPIQTFNVGALLTEFSNKFCQDVPSHARKECELSVRDQYNAYAENSILWFQKNPEQSKYAFFIGGICFLIVFALWVITFFIRRFNNIGYQVLLFLIWALCLIIAIIGIINITRINFYINQELLLLNSRNTATKGPAKSS